MSKDRSIISPSNNNCGHDDGDDHDYKGKELLDLSQLPKAKGWFKPGATLYQGCWFPSDTLRNVISFQTKFQAHDQDIILASNPKSGTTWLNSLMFSILNRARYTPSNTPLLTKNPHQLVPSLEFTIFSEPPIHELRKMSSPRFISTHMPYASLTDAIKGPPCGARIIYICRNPLDTIVSFWCFANRGHPFGHDPAWWSLEECVETFCKGESWFGPFWTHVLGYWKASLENPEKVLFLKYEDMLEDTISHVKRLAEFIRFPFSEEEERNGVVELIVELCSLGSLKELDVNKNGKVINLELENKKFFRKGEVGDWVNHLSPSMVERVSEVTEEKLCGSELTFKFKI